MTAAYLIVAGFAVVVVGVLVKVGIDVARDVREDRRDHGGRLTTQTFYRALAVIAFAVLLVLFLIVLPLWVGSSGD